MSEREYSARWNGRELKGAAWRAAGTLAVALLIGAGGVAVTFVRMQSEVGHMRRDLGEIKQGIESIDQRTERLDGEIGALEQEVYQRLRPRVEDLQARVRQIQQASGGAE